MAIKIEDAILRMKGKLPEQACVPREDGAEPLEKLAGVEAEQEAA